MLVVVTGLDGSGTSTIAEKISKLDKGSLLRRTPGEEFSNRHEIDLALRNESGVGHLLYYLSSVVAASDYIKKHFDYKNENVYLVRYLIDTVVSHRVAGIPIDLDYNIYGDNLLVPDLTLFLKVDEKERQSRISKRGKDDLDKVLDDYEKRKRFLEEYDNLLLPEKTIIVENSENPEIVAEKAYQKIKKYHQSNMKNNNIQR